jgi:amino acid permease
MRSADPAVAPDRAAAIAAEETTTLLGSPETSPSAGSDHDEELLPDQKAPHLRRELSWVDTLVMLVSCVVGSGIFVAPGVVMASSGSVALGLASWLFAGTLAGTSALVYAELGAETLFLRHFSQLKNDNFTEAGSG